MNFKPLIRAILYKLETYQRTLVIFAKHLLRKTYYHREKNYYAHIGETKQLFCKHKNISKLSPTKYYCTDCGKVLHFVPEELFLIAELFGIFLIGSIVYLLTRKKKL